MNFTIVAKSLAHGEPFRITNFSHALQIKGLKTFRLLLSCINNELIYLK